MNKKRTAIPRKKHSIPNNKNYLIIIGIDTYTNHPDLNNAVADAKSFTKVMINRYGFQHLCKPLYNKKATQQAIRKALGKSELLDEYDNLIIFYAGHGWYKPKSNVGYIVPSTAKDNPHSDFIPVGFFTDIFKSVDARHILLVVDCCFGGTFGADRNLRIQSSITEKYIQSRYKKKSRMVLSSGGIEPVSDGLLKNNNSPFTKAFVSYLQKNQKPNILLSEFFTIIAKQAHWNANQLPQYKVLQNLGHADGELVFHCTKLTTEGKKTKGDSLIDLSSSFDFEPEMILVKGGIFNMGSTRNKNEQPIHEVLLKDFYIGKHLITQREWIAVMGENPSYFKGNINCPVENVSWKECQLFIKKLRKLTGKKYRLPSEAEWEFAAKGGNYSNNYIYSGDSSIIKIAWYDTNSAKKTHTVGAKRANELGIYDLSGNVWEWCQDTWHENYKGAPSRGKPWVQNGDKNLRVVRGGSWLNDKEYCTITKRTDLNLGIGDYITGFRLTRY